jgi:uncharacterized protein YndB with AHSA1/START domain
VAITNSVVINRPIDEVFDAAVDLRNELKWNPRVQKMEKITDGPVGLGTQMRAKWSKSTDITCECTEFVRPRSWTWVNGGPFPVTLRIVLSEEPDGTRLTASFDPSAKGIMRLALPVFVRMMRKEEAQTLEHFHRYMEDLPS